MSSNPTIHEFFRRCRNPSCGRLFPSPAHLGAHVAGRHGDPYCSAFYAMLRDQRPKRRKRNAVGAVSVPAAGAASTSAFCNAASANGSAAEDEKARQKRASDAVGAVSVAATGAAATSACNAASASAAADAISPQNLKRRRPSDAVSLELHRVTTENEALSAYALIDGAARSMLSRFGLTHWLYPFKNPDLIKALAMSSTAAVYIARDKESGDDLATVTISSVPLSGWYELSMWQAPAEPAAYIGNLAIDPTRARRGIGRAVLAASARVARATLGASWIRCDAITAHPHLQGFYEGAGWRQRGVAFSVSIKNPLARGATGAPGPPGSPAYVVNAEAPPPDDENVPFACQAYEAMTGDSTAA